MHHKLYYFTVILSTSIFYIFLRDFLYFAFWLWYMRITNCITLRLSSALLYFPLRFYILHFLGWFSIFCFMNMIYRSLGALWAPTSRWRPFGLLTSSFAPFGRSGRVTHAKLTNSSFSTSTAMMHESMMHISMIHESLIHVSMMHVLMMHVSMMHDA